MKKERRRKKMVEWLQQHIRRKEGKGHHLRLSRRKRTAKCTMWSATRHRAHTSPHLQREAKALETQVAAVAVAVAVAAVAVAAVTAAAATVRAKAAAVEAVVVTAVTVTPATKAPRRAKIATIIGAKRTTAAQRKVKRRLTRCRIALEARSRASREVGSFSHPHCWLLHRLSYTQRKPALLPLLRLLQRQCRLLLLHQLQLQRQLLLFHQGSLMSHRLCHRKDAQQEEEVVPHRRQLQHPNNRQDQNIRCHPETEDHQTSRI